jgi:hypothetical protein
LATLGFLIVQRVNGDVFNQSEPAMTTQPNALDTYFQRLPTILDKIDALRQLADDHFGHAPDATHWGHVGDLGRVDQVLDDLLAIFDGRSK